MSNIDDLLRKRKQILEDIDNQIKADFTKPVTLLFTDIVGSTSYFERWGDIAGRQMIQTHNDLLFPLIESYAGNIIKTIGDAIMASYENPEKAVQSAVAMQEQLKGFNSTKPDHEKIRVRMGLHYGRAVIEEKDLFGDMVNTAARVESKAGGGEILISGSLHDQLPGVLDPSVIFLGSDFVKGKDKKIDFYLVNWDHKTSEEILRSWGNQVPQVPQVPQSSSNTPTSTAAADESKFKIIGVLDLKRELKALNTSPGQGNPYLNRVMLPHPYMFYGRKSLVKRVMQRISADSPQSVSLVGERRIGKSSLLKYLSQASVRSLYLSSAERVFFLLIDFQQFRLLDAGQFVSLIFLNLKKQFGTILDFNLPEDLGGLAQLCESLSEHNFKLIFLFDEFECVTKNDRIGPEFYSFLRSLANNFAVSFVTASGRNLKDMCISREISDSPFFNIFSVIRVGLMDEPSARELITSPSRERGIDFTPLAAQVLELGGLYPFFLQMACASWFDYLELEEKEPQQFIDRPVPPAVLKQFREESAPHFEYVLETCEAQEINVFKRVLQAQDLRDDKGAQQLALKGYLYEDEEGVLRPFSQGFTDFLKRYFA